MATEVATKGAVVTRQTAMEVTVVTRQTATEVMEVNGGAVGVGVELTASRPVLHR